MPTNKKQALRFPSPELIASTGYQSVWPNEDKKMTIPLYLTKTTAYQTSKKERQANSNIKKQTEQNLISTSTTPVKTFTLK